jgi:hypothetical protein
MFARKPTLTGEGEGIRVVEGRVPSELLSAIVDAVRSQSPARMRELAARLRREGFPEQARGLEQAASELEQAAAPGVPVEEVDQPPPGAVPVDPSPPQAPAPRPPVVREPPVQVDEPPPGAVPVPNDDDRRIPQGTDSLAAAYARMVYDSAPRGPVRDLALSEEFKRSTGVRGDKRFYGQGPALALIARGVVPPTPWDWQVANPAQDKASYKRQLTQARLDDPSRSDLWDQAIASVV